jgi:hypothetical protein
MDMQKMLDLTLRNSSLKSELQKSQEELNLTRKYLLDAICQEDHQKFKNIPLTKLIDILKRSLKQSSSTTVSSTSISRNEQKSTSKPLPSIRVKGPKLDNTTPHTLRASSGSHSISTNNVENDSQRLAVAAAGTEKKLEEAESRFKTTQRRCWALERENKVKQEAIDHWQEKTEEVSKHCERLMFHLKQETAAKATALFRADMVGKKLKKTKKRIVSLGKEKDQIVFKMTLLKQGAEILEGQLRSLDARFIQLRGTLDWQVHHSRVEILECSREFVRLSSQIEDFRTKWNDAEDRVRRLDYDVKYLRTTRALSIPTQKTVTEADEMSSEEEEEDEAHAKEDEEEDEEEKKEETKKKKKSCTKKSPKQEVPMWKYETVSTSGAEPPPEW